MGERDRFRWIDYVQRVFVASVLLLALIGLGSTMGKCSGGSGGVDREMFHPGAP